jgi:hypothetical protein
MLSEWLDKWQQLFEYYRRKYYHTTGRTTYVTHLGNFFYRKLYNGVYRSTIWQNKTHFYTILTTNLYDKSQTKNLINCFSKIHVCAVIVSFFIHETLVFVTSWSRVVNLRSGSKQNICWTRLTLYSNYILYMKMYL